MAFRYFYKNDDGDLVEIVNRVQTGYADKPGSDGLTMNAEEGSIGVSTLRVEDPDGTWAFPRGHRRLYVIEEEAEYDDFGGVVYSGYTAKRNFTRDTMREGAARIVTMDVQDINLVFDRRVMVGSDANRPAETGGERLAWLMSTNEANLIDDFTYFDDSDPTAMDANDYRGMSFRQVVADVSLQSGWNWYLWPSVGGYSFWYMARGTTDFSSDIRISNILDDLDADTFAPAFDSGMDRDPDRVYSGIYRSYANSHLYTQNEDTATKFARRDTTASSPTIKTKLKALVRNERELGDIDEEEDIVTTSIIVPRARANAVVPGHRIQLRYSHFPDLEEFTWMRVLNRTVRELGLDEIELALELARDEPVDDHSGVGAVFGTLCRPKGYNHLDRLWYDWVGDFPDTGGGRQPTVGLIEALSDVAGPLAPTWIYYGWKINGTGTVDIHCSTSTIGITATTVTYSVLKNGVSIHDEVGGDGIHNGIDFDFNLSGVPVDVDDVLTTAIHCDPPATPFFQAPRGVGSNSERFTITGGTVL